MELELSKSIITLGEPVTPAKKGVSSSAAVAENGSNRDSKMLVSNRGSIRMNWWRIVLVFFMAIFCVLSIRVVNCLFILLFL